MNIPAESAAKSSVCEFDTSEPAFRENEWMWFLVWMGIWLFALAALLPALI